MSRIKAGLHWLAVWLLLVLLVGSCGAFFLWSLEAVTAQRLAHPWLLWLLPLAGGLVSWVYWRWGGEVEAGHHLLLRKADEGAPVASKPVPLRMLPLILGGTLVSHLFGASVGREGTALQMGGAVADQLRLGRVWTATDRRRLMLMGISAGFGAVFGTPWAAAIFALEIAYRRRFEGLTLIACLLSAWGADQVAQAWGATHPHEIVHLFGSWTVWLWGQLLVAALGFGLFARLFLLACQGLAGWMQRSIHFPPLRPVLGGSLLVLLVTTLGGEAYLGLSLPLLSAAFDQTLPWWDSLGKFGLTLLSLGSGFKGGEVTPLFVMGATLGNSFAQWMALPVSAMAALGLVGVFAAATRTPWASSVLAIELFGLDIALFALFVCWIACWVAGRRGLYTPKT